MRDLAVIAREIARDYKAPANAYAMPYIRAMACLGSIDEGYGVEGAREIVLRFLCNAQTWRGDTARRVKAELKGMLK